MSAEALRLLAEAHDALAGMSDSDLDYFESEEDEIEAVPMQYAARKVMAAMQLLQATPRAEALQVAIDPGREEGDMTAEVRWYHPNEIEAIQQHAYAEGRKDEAEEHTAPLLETLRDIHTRLASNLAFDMSGAPETGWDAVAALIVRDIDLAISATYPTLPA
jgi:hypothetical protein